MIYNNLIYLLIVLLILTTNNVPDSAQTPIFWAALFFLLKGITLVLASKRLFSPGRTRQASDYFTAERNLSILAIVSLAADVYFLDFKFYIAKLPIVANLPVLADLGGIILFHFYLALMWIEAEKTYGVIFEKKQKKYSFLVDNLKTNLSIVLPWIILSFFSDFLQLLPLPGVKRVLASTWGEPVIFIVFFIILATLFPVMVTRLWNCTPMPRGELRDHMEKFCRRQNLKYADIMIWPLFEGKIMTAGIMGITGRFRYLLVTPALLNALSIEEIEAVMAHEIGHVKRYHLQLYIFLFLGFGLLAQVSMYPFLYLLFNSDFFYRHILLAGNDPGQAMSLIGTVPLFVIMLVYFRFIFGFFMRNFERQADLYAMDVMGGSAPLVRVLEKIGWMSGNIRDVPSWHHFSIRQRVEFLEKSEEKRTAITGHHRKVHTALLFYLLFLVGGGLLMWKMPASVLEGPTREKIAEAVITQKIKEEPGQTIWYRLLGDLQQERKLYREAAEAYEAVLTTDPYNPEVLNNLAWLLVTAMDDTILDPARALPLAETAARIKPQGYIIDTLAAVYWANGYKDLAVDSEKQALAKDPANQAYYLKQMRLFQEQSWSPDLLRQTGEH